MAKRNIEQEYADLIREWRCYASTTAWEELWVRLFPYLVRCASTILPDADDQIDVASEAFVSKIMGNIHTFNPATARFTTWCWRITQNAARDVLRRRHTDQLDMRTAALIETTPDHSTGEIATISSYTVFFIPDEAIREIVLVWLAHESQPTLAAQQAVEAILDTYDVAWRTHGSIRDITTFLFAVVRLAKLTDDDRAIAYRALNQLPPNSPAGLAMQFLGKERLALMLLLFGGTELQLPAIGALKR